MTLMRVLADFQIGKRSTVGMSLWGAVRNLNEARASVTERFPTSFVCHKHEAGENCFSYLICHEDGKQTAQEIIFVAGTMQLHHRAASTSIVAVRLAVTYQAPVAFCA